MTDVQLAWLSTVAWFVVTSALFVALARWSAGDGAWGSLPGIVRGLRGWAAPWEPTRQASSPAATAPGEPTAEIEDL